MVTGRINILIVEDEAVPGLLLKVFLSNEGYNIVGIVPTGEEAIELVKNENIDFILMDIQLGGSLNGIDAAREILRIRKIPFLFMTGFPDDDIREKALELEPVAYLIKPVVTGELVQILKTGISGGRI